MAWIFTTEIRKADLIELIDVDGHWALLDEGLRSLLTDEPPLIARRARSVLPGPVFPDSQLRRGS
jgi:hypothetical protein